ncbi:ARMADILLO BTB ARABIDOPSIS PROTEIN 1-like [Pomacea canaliculata]|uniref:ARMADILLO BTB ARABIDOPSIS PROTEIN 1-like n=1 Tax=Pomacea canaliculata TaxID=400727 RepID=UPI000D736B1A|nr:ARMADILLO BTB ARABIDOPSIS PROTEIN 1-like [Pomacea canaliculata]
MKKVENPLVAFPRFVLLSLSNISAMEGISAKQQWPQISKNRFQVRDEFSDVAFVVQGQRLYVSKTVMMMHSPVFQKMFTADFREKNLQEIPLPQKRYEVVVNFLEQLYPGEGVDLIKDETLDDLLQLAEEYQAEQVFINCKQFIAKQLQRMTRGIGLFSVQDTDRRLFYLELAQRYQKLSSLRENLIAMVSQIQLKDLQQSERFSALSVELQRDILMQRVKIFEG